MLRFPSFGPKKAPEPRPQDPRQWAEHFQKQPQPSRSDTVALPLEPAKRERRPLDRFTIGS